MPRHSAVLFRTYGAVLISAGLLAGSAILCAQNQPQNVPAASPAVQAVSYANEGAVVEQSETVYRYNEDGTGERIFSVRLKIQSEAGARQYGVLSFPFASSEEFVEMQNLAVHHADGSTTETPAKDGMELSAPVTQLAPLYSDIKFLQIPVRGLRVGDLMEYRVRIVRKNVQTPGNFWGSYTFFSNVVALKESLTLDAPVNKYVKVWNRSELTPETHESAGRRLTTWTTSQLKPTPAKQNDDDSEETTKEMSVDVGWSTFHSWDEVGQWYRTLSAPRAASNDALKAQADEITHSATTPEEKVAALYNYVASRIRYVGVDFGIGRFQPHVAAEVLASQFGDCKDKDTLFRAMLGAEGFHASPALIGANVKLVEELPSPGFFNHVITAVELPSGRVWADSTPGIAAFGMLMAPLRDKSALLIPASGPAGLQRTPAMPPFALSDRFEAKGELSKDGEMKSQMHASYRSDSEVFARAIVQYLSPAQWNQGAQALSNAMGFSGTASNARFEHVNEASSPLEVSYDYVRKSYGDWDNFRILPLFPIMSFPASPDKKPKNNLEFGAVRTESALSRIHLPEGYGADLPGDIHVRTSFASLDKTYKLENSELIVERKIEILQSKLPADQWEIYKKFMKDASIGEESWIQLTTQSSTETGAHPPNPGENNPIAASLIAEAIRMERIQNWSAALEKLKQAKALNPKQPYLWSNYGYVAMLQNRLDEAKADYRKELALYPHEPFVVQLYAGFLIRQKEKDEARVVLKTYFDTDASDERVAFLLASLEADRKIDDGIVVLRRAAEAAPHNQMIQYRLADFLIRAQQFPEAVSIAKKMIDQADAKPVDLNNAAYILAQTGLELEVAEQASRRSLESLESASATEAVGEANQQCFCRSGSLIAYWDTLGYILLREKKLDEARDYLEAAWRNRPSLDIGSHYGEMLEREGNEKEALRIFELTRCQNPDRVPNYPEEDQVDNAITRLKAAGISSFKFDKASGQTALQEERTFKVTGSAPVKAFFTATYRLNISSSGIEELLHVNGKTAPAGLESAIKKIPLPRLTPSRSKARILRDAVVTCSPGQTTCYVVLMPMGGIQAEQVSN